MNNAPKIEAYNSFYQQGKEIFATGDIIAAREAFLKAAELANDISVNSTTYDVRMEYHNLANKILEFVRTQCVKKPARKSEPTTADIDDSITRPPIPAENEKSSISFDDVAGLDDVKEQIIFKVLEPMRNPELAKMYHINAGGKILLYGPPGTGKTYIARAIAGEVDARFYVVNCQDLISKYMGDSSKQLDALFDEAEKNERAIIFFDEFDSVASKRVDGTSGVDAEMARFVATFLTRVDGFKKKDKSHMLLLIAATNRPWALDSAMLRGGRFDIQIYIGVPDREARFFLIKKTIGTIPYDEDVSLEKLADVLEGYGGGDIVAVCERIIQGAYMRAVKLKTPQNITKDDCNHVLANTRNVITKDEIVKFEIFRAGGTIE